MNRLLLALLALLASVSIQAQTVGIHLASQHYPSNPSFNNENLGAYVRLDGGWTAGFYRNTYRRESFYVGKTYYVGPLDLAFGAVSGYRVDNDRRAVIMPLFVPSVGLGTYWGVTPRLFVMPSGKTTVVHLGLETHL